MPSRARSPEPLHSKFFSPENINWEAYSAYLKGRHMLLDTKTDDSVRLAIGYFQQAIKTDPQFALGYAGLADAYAERGPDAFCPRGLSAL